MKFLVAATGFITLVFSLRHLQRVRRKRMRQHIHQIQFTRVFEPEKDPFNPSERIEIYHHKD